MLNLTTPASFAKAASSYLKHNQLQATIASHLKLMLEEYQTSLIQVDLGAGHGSFNNLNYKPQGTLINLDLNLKALVQNRLGSKIKADSHYLPFKNQSVDLIFSNLMLQWSKSPLIILNETSRVLRPQAKLVFSTLINPSLTSFKQAWLKICNHPQSLDFLDLTAYLNLTTTAGFNILEYKIIPLTYWFNTAKELLNHFKLNGTNLNHTTHQPISIQQYHCFEKYVLAKKWFPIEYYSLIIKGEKSHA